MEWKSIQSGVLGTALLLMIASTVYEVVCNACDRKHFEMHFNDVIVYIRNLVIFILGPKYQPFLVFSVNSNITQLFPHESPKSRNAIHCIDGIRSLSIMWVVFVHSNWKYMGLPLREKEEFSKVTIV